MLSFRSILWTALALGQVQWRYFAKFKFDNCIWKVSNKKVWNRKQGSALGPAASLRTYRKFYLCIEPLLRPAEIRSLNWRATSLIKSAIRSIDRSMIGRPSDHSIKLRHSNWKTRNRRSQSELFLVSPLTCTQLCARARCQTSLKECKVNSKVSSKIIGTGHQMKSESFRQHKSLRNG